MSISQELSYCALVLDGDTRAALAVVRSLGKRGIDVVVAATSDREIAVRSRYCKRFIEMPDPLSSPLEYICKLKEVCRMLAPAVIMPITDASVRCVLNSDLTSIENIIVPFISSEIFEKVSNKGFLLNVAGDLGVKVPKTLSIKPDMLNDEKVVSDIGAFEYPAVLKPSYSVSNSNNCQRKLKVSYVNNASGVINIVKDEIDGNIEFLLQQKIEGQGVGVFALMVNGESCVVFAHERLLEKPPSGGVSVLSKSIAIEKAPVDAAIQLLKYFSWNGVAMVEFKRDRNGDFFLMEINPRFWGSLQLSIDSGVDFPYILWRFGLLQSSGQIDAIKGECVQFADYKCEKRLRWWLGTVDHALIRFKKEGVSFLKDVFMKNALFVSWNPFNTYSEIFRFSDPYPAVYEFVKWAKALILQYGRR